MGFGVWGLGFGVWGWGLGFEVWGLAGLAHMSNHMKSATQLLLVKRAKHYASFVAQAFKSQTLCLPCMLWAPGVSWVGEGVACHFEGAPDGGVGAGGVAEFVEGHRMTAKLALFEVLYPR